MRRIALLIILLNIPVLLQAQADSRSKSFDTIVLDEEDLGSYSITSSYYTIDSIFNSRNSAFYMSDPPSAEYYLMLANVMPSYFFVVHQDEYLVAWISLQQDSSSRSPFQSYSYQFYIPGGGISTHPCLVWGDISEHRANELIAMGIDISARIIDLPNEGKGLLFDGIVYRIQPFDKVYEEVKGIAKWLYTSQIENLELTITMRSAKDQDLDFDKVLENDPQQFYLYDGVAYNRNDYAILLWGKAVARMGMKSTKKACKLWEEIHGRKLSDPETKALKKGFKG